MKTAVKILETDLYQPVHDFFTQLGYEVHGEVKGCDLTASKGEEIIIVELKRRISLELLIQAVKRQRLTSEVYIAVPRPDGSLPARKWKDLCLLVRRLELGLITVFFQGASPRVEIPVFPAPFDRAKSRQASRRQLKGLQAELAGRHGSWNIGGSTGKKLMTAYKEQAIQIACCLRKYGPLTPKELRTMGCGPKTTSILYNNYYGWFERVERGLYQLCPRGEEELKAFPEPVAYYYSLLAEQGDEERK